MNTIDPETNEPKDPEYVLAELITRAAEREQLLRVLRLGREMSHTDSIEWATNNLDALFRFQDAAEDAHYAVLMGERRRLQKMHPGVKTRIAQVRSSDRKD